MNDNSIRKALLIFGTTMVFSMSSFAQGQKRQGGKKPPTFEQLLKDMDSNEDGKLSKEEIKGPLKDNFSKVDADEDGFITKKEFDKAPKPKRPERRQK